LVKKLKLFVSWKQVSVEKQSKFYEIYGFKKGFREQIVFPSSSLLLLLDSG
jgi:hypothetical protein